MPPALEIIDLDSEDDELPDAPSAKPADRPARQPLIPVINRSIIRPENQYPDGPLPIRPSIHAPRKARITGRVADDDGVNYTLMVGEIQIDNVAVDEILSYVSPYDLEEFENAQFIEEEQLRKIAKAAADLEREAKRLRKVERNRRKGVVLERNDDSELSEDGELDEDGEVVLGRHGRVRPDYTKFYKPPGGGNDGAKRRRRKRDPATGELMPLSDEGSSDDEPMRAAGRSEASRSSALAAGLELPKRRRRKRHPITRELMPLSDDDNTGMASSDDGQGSKRTGRLEARGSSVIVPGLEPKKRRRRKRHPVTKELMPLSDDGDSPSSDEEVEQQQSAISSFVRPVNPPEGSLDRRTMAPPAIPNIIRTTEPFARISSPKEMALPARSGSTASTSLPVRSSEVGRMTPNVAIEVAKRRRRKRDPATGELLPLDYNSSRNATQITPSSRLPSAPVPEDRQKRPRRRRHPVTGELMPLGWVYDKHAEEKSFKTQAEMPSSMRKLSITPRDSKRVKLTSEPSSQDELSAQKTASPQARRTIAIDLESSDSEDDSSSMQLSVLNSAPGKMSTQTRSPNQVRSPKHGMMQKPISSSSSSSNNEPITLASFLSTTATGKANQESSEDSSEESAADKTKTASQKTSMMNPMAADEEEESEDGDDELDEGEFFVEEIRAHHWSDPRTHPGKDRVMLYHTKWVGFEELTWEPAASFGDPDVVREYRRRVGLDK